ncbi:hypothetical protein RT761_00989 [Atribacter laminatus]|jgi:hypothetical protein|uniref:Uncharacterized protein n=1 Tax=Atribacter laminatus TaxID=2847778 RepID=A0A7T1AKU5_ATRLM|nr:hypothetical protein RT761_00989 [Atribacter laminatus]
MKIGIPLTLTLSHEGAREKNYIIPSPLMGEGEDEGGFLNCSQFTLHGSRYFQDRMVALIVLLEEIYYILIGKTLFLKTVNFLNRFSSGPSSQDDLLCQNNL